MRKVFNIAVAVIFSLIIAGPFALLAADEVGMRLPSWLTAEDAQYLSGGIVENDVGDNLTFSGYRSRDLQTAIESEIGNYIPCKALAMLSNATLQRSAIECANAVAGWECYPSTFTSPSVIVPQQGIIIPFAHTQQSLDWEAIDGWIATVNLAAEHHPDVRFAYDLVSDMYTTDANPSSELISNSIVEDSAIDEFAAKLNPSIEFLCERIPSVEEMSKRWNKTEHHWKLERALQAYNNIGATFEWIPVDYENDFLAADAWYGTSGRSGLFLGFTDEWRDLPTDFSYMTATANGKPITRGYRDIYMNGGSVDATTDFYWGYYGGCLPEVVYDNPTSTNEKCCLFVETSYSIPLEAYIAQNYRTTICIAPINCPMEQTIDDYLDECDIDDVVIQTGFADIQYGVTKSPRSFGN